MMQDAVNPDPRHAKRAADRAARRQARLDAMRVATGLQPRDTSKPPTASTPAPMPVVCTNKGQHKRTVLSMKMTALAPPDARQGDPGTVDHVLYQFEKCPRCGRDEQMRAERYAKVQAALRDAGYTELDISRLPF